MIDILSKERVAQARRFLTAFTILTLSFKQCVKTCLITGIGSTKCQHSKQLRGQR